MPDIKVDEPLAWIRQHVHEKYGIYFPENKLYSLQSKLKRRVRELELEDIEQYAEYFRDNPDEVPYFLDAVTTNKTKFFREEKHWEFMEEELLAEWKDKSDLRIWSAACSSGEEPYTVGMLLEEAKKSYTGFPSYRILASDISEEVLRVGARGIYFEKDLNPIRSYSPGFVSEYLEEEEEGKYRVIDKIRNNVYFRQFNLKFDRDPFRYKFDLIIVKNVLIYFDREMIENVILNCEDLLADDGILYISHTESINDIDHNLDKIQPSIFRK